MKTLFYSIYFQKLDFTVINTLFNIYYYIYKLTYPNIWKPIIWCGITLM